MMLSLLSSLGVQQQLVQWLYKYIVHCDTLITKLLALAADDPGPLVEILTLLMYFGVQQKQLVQWHK